MIDGVGLGREEGADGDLAGDGDGAEGGGALPFARGGVRGERRERDPRAGDGEAHVLRGIVLAAIGDRRADGQGTRAVAAPVISATSPVVSSSSRAAGVEMTAAGAARGALSSAAATRGATDARSAEARSSDAAAGARFTRGP